MKYSKFTIKAIVVASLFAGQANAMFNGTPGASTSGAAAASSSVGTPSSVAAAAAAPGEATSRAGAEDEELRAVIQQILEQADSSDREKDFLCQAFKLFRGMQLNPSFFELYSVEQLARLIEMTDYMRGATCNKVHPLQGVYDKKVHGAGRREIRYLDVSQLPEVHRDLSVCYGVNIEDNVAHLKQAVKFFKTDKAGCSRLYGVNLCFSSPNATFVSEWQNVELPNLTELGLELIDDKSGIRRSSCLSSFLLGRFSHLTSLRLKGFSCMLSMIPLCLKARLSSLSLTDCSAEMIDGLVFRNLKSIDLHRINTWSLSAVLKNMEELEEITLNYNEIVGLQMLLSCPKLKKVAFYINHSSKENRVNDEVLNELRIKGVTLVFHIVNPFTGAVIETITEE